MLLSLSLLNGSIPFQRNLAFLQLSDALASRTQADAAALAQVAQLSLESLDELPTQDAIGISLLAQGKTEEAVDVWKKSGMPSHLLLFWARYYEEQQQLDFALKWHQAAVELEPTSAQAWHALGLYYRRREQWSAASAAQQQAIQLNSTYRDAWYELAWAQMMLGNNEEAVQGFQQALNAQGDNIGTSSIYYYLGHLYHSLLNPPQLDVALHKYEQAIALHDYQSPYWSERNLAALAHYQRGRILLEAGQVGSAIAEYERALSLDAENYPAQLALALAKWQQGEREQAIQLAYKAINLSPDRVNAYHVLASFYQENGNIAQAEEIYSQILEIDPRDKSAREQLDRLTNR